MKFFIDDIDADCCILESYLDQLEIKSGTDRKVLCKEGGSMLYGNTWRGTICKGKYSEARYREVDPNVPENCRYRYKTECKRKYPILEEVFKEFAKLHLNDFKFNQVMINENYKIGWHYDKKNTGISYMITIGNFVGGRTILRKPNKEGYEYTFLNSHNFPICFNGSEIEHSAENHDGHRYALIFFNVEY